MFIIWIVVEKSGQTLVDRHCIRIMEINILQLSLKDKLCSSCVGLLAKCAVSSHRKGRHTVKKMETVGSGIRTSTL